MFVIVLNHDPHAGSVSWVGRRHDDDEEAFVTGTSAEELFDAVFGALRDGEQVAVGVAGPVAATVPDGRPSEAELGDAPPPLGHLVELLRDLGYWRPWTVVTTSREHWLATESLLAFETPPGTAATEAISAFFARFVVYRPS